MYELNIKVDVIKNLKNKKEREVCVERGMLFRWAMGFLSVGGIIWIVFPAIGHFLVTVGVIVFAVWVGTWFFGR